MKSHFDLTDAEFIAQFRKATLDPAIFNHEAHLRLAWIHVRQHGVEKAVEVVTGQLKNFVGILGFKDKYHHTVTVAAVRAVNHFMTDSTTENFEEFIKEQPRLKTNFKDLLNQHYSSDIFTSKEARNKYLEPDLLPF